MDGKRTRGIRFMEVKSLTNLAVSDEMRTAENGESWGALSDSKSKQLTTLVIKLRL